jgi:hypothetical protein
MHADMVALFTDARAAQQPEYGMTMATSVDRACAHQNPSRMCHERPLAGHCRISGTNGVCLLSYAALPSGASKPNRSDSGPAVR